ncbi:MAG: enoyl-CoA hydratase/isomerase family protein [Phenylobacterium sp.]|uniref:enoyl-CoA hydratase/isomerase family protein n=1 Tax=Phenylobacterium sp. TaxID=1871053 RepID=UPI001A37D7CE|nr:enoyl-CoA hydratase/isomerase family protein [Phenylobacterium sp.]MBL8770635.1 enoyl-CoA hydratase/isomerase family protein [Phenylobacterium sp.]
MGDLVIRTDRDGAATLTLNRPDKLNALNVALFQELDAAVRRLAGETETVGLVIVRGAGRCFCAGHDLADIAAGEKLPEPFYQSKVIERLANLPQPVISAVHGHCYTGGLELALAGDLIFAAEGARFADTHAKWALTPVWGMSQRLPRRVGTYRARELMFTCRTVMGPEALSLGLADLCVPDAEFDARLEELCGQILANSWFSHRANKRLLVETDGMTQSEGLAHEIFRGAGRGPDMEARIAGFQNKTVKQA